MRHPVGNLFLFLLDAFFLWDVCLQVSPPQLVASYFDSFLLIILNLELLAFNLLTAPLCAIDIYQMNNNKNKAY